MCSTERQRIEYGIGYKLGVAIDHRAGFVTEQGLQFEKIKSGDVFWTVD